MSKRRVPIFTVEELRAIHRSLHGAPWSPDLFYDERRAVLEKLAKFFGDDEEHLGRRSHIRHTQGEKP